MSNIRVRFAPSPTGFLHIGGLRTALYDYLFARSRGGKFILRIEDTDQSREVPGAVDNLISSLHQLGIDFDEGPGIGGKYAPYIQSQRLELYQEHAQRLVSSGNAYHCFCSPDTLKQMREEQQAKGEFVKYDRRCLQLSPNVVTAKLQAGEKHTIRVKMPDQRRFVFSDLIRGTVEMDASQSDDQVLLKSDGFPTYHLAAVVDDHYMEISHVIRGEEWLSSTPKHLWLYECFGWEAPLWVHLPLILSTDRSKLSKRMNDVSVESYLSKGYLKEALLNFVALLGWHSADDREFYSLSELCSAFSLERVNKAGAIFDLTKLDWMNGHYLRNLPLETITERCEPYFETAGISCSDHQKHLRIIAAARERCTLLPEIVEYSRMFYSSPGQLSTNDQATINGTDAQRVLSWLVKALQQLPSLEAADIHTLCEQGMHELELKPKTFYAPLRLALLGKQNGPDLPTILQILGIREACNRMGKLIS